MSEYICDSPGCPNIAEQVLGVIPELRAFVAVCPEHAPKPNAANHEGGHSESA